MTAEKVQENRLRRVATRSGFRLLKSRRRDPEALDYGGYMLVDAETGMAVLGTSPRGFCGTLDDVEKYFSEGKSRRNKSVKTERPRAGTRKRS